MEIKQRMLKRWAWLFGLVVLVLVAVLVACGNSYDPMSDGLVIVSSQGSGLLETFSFSLVGGNNIPILNSPLNTNLETCVLNGEPSSLVLNPAATFAFTIINENVTCSGSKTGIQAFSVQSSGNMTAVGGLVADPNPVALAMDSSGKFLFVAEGCLNATAPGSVHPTQPCETSTVFGVRTYAISSSGSLTLVPGTFNFQPQPGFQTPNFVALAPTPTVLPPLQNGITSAVCSNPHNSALTTEYLYVADSVNNAVWEFGVDTSTGALSNPPSHTFVPYFTTGSVPYGIVVEPCNRFVYVTNMLSNTVSGYSICNGLPTESTTLCPKPVDGSLVPVPGSPYSLTASANGPGPVVSDPFGNHIYVLDTLSNQISPFAIGSVSGNLTAGNVAATGLQPISITIRGDDNWLFVTNYNAATMSQYSVTPLTGALQALPAITTDNYPFGIAVK